MAHKTKINGTNYEVSGGKTLIGGTAYKITGGRTLIDGTAYAISFVAKPEASTLNDCSWETISEVSESGQAANYWSVGDTKTITINGTVGTATFSSVSIDAFIIGIYHNSDKEGSNKIHFQLGKIDDTNIALADTHYEDRLGETGWFCMNTSNSNYGGWESCHMRRTVLGSDSTPSSPTSATLLAALPSDLRAVMKPITKYSDNTGQGSDSPEYVTATTDYLWLLSEFEVKGETVYANSVERYYQVQYDYYKAGNPKKKYRYDFTNNIIVTSDAAYWWTRSVNAAISTRFVCCSSIGGSASKAPRCCYGVAPAFAV